MPDRAVRPRTGSSAKALLLTILGEFTARQGDAVWTSTVIDALARFDVGERNARQAVARLAEQGVIEPVRSGRRTRWHLSPTGKRLLMSGSERIYGFGSSAPTWDRQWLVVLASVPEDQRAKRHELRRQLEFEGFGFIASAVAVSPHVDREQSANRLLTHLDLTDTAVVFLARAGSFVPDHELIARAWDLETLASRYEQFTDEFAPRKPKSAEDRFVALAELVHAWRRFPFGDPEIPDELLPTGWPGRRAKTVFDSCHERWSDDAVSWYRNAEAGGST